MYKSLLTNHPLVNILFVVVLMMGLLGYVSMPREQDPEINFNWVIVRTILPGASAEDVEQLVTGPLEDAIRNVQDIRWVISTTRENASNILIRFRDLSEREFDKRINDIRREVQAKSNDELPDEAEDPYILEVTTSSGFPTGLVVVEGQADDETLRRLGRIVREDLERLQGVDQVISIGLHEPELHVEFEAREMAARGMLATDIADSLGQAFRDTFAGKTRVAGNEWLVRVEGTTNNPEILADFQVAPFNAPSSLIALNDVAAIKRGREDATQLVSFGGQAAIALSVTKIANTNTIKLIDRINEYIANKNSQLDGTGVKLVLADDQTVATRNAISIMQNNALLGLTLVLIVCWAFLGFRIATMVTLGILFSIAGTLWVLNATGNTLNVSVLLGIVIVLGMLVDDAVVVVEAMFYRIQRGADGLQAALDSMAEVARPVTSAVLTTMAAFLPLMLLPGIVGKFMFVIPFVVTVGLAVSLVEAFWILPSHVISMRASRQQRQRHELHTPRNDRRTRWTHWIRVKYTRLLCYVMRRPVRFLAAGSLAFMVAVSAVSMGLIRMEFFLADPVRLFYVNLDMPADAPLEETLRQGVLVEQEVLKHLQPSEVRAITVNAGMNRGGNAKLAHLNGQCRCLHATRIPPAMNLYLAFGIGIDTQYDRVTAVPGDRLRHHLRVFNGGSADNDALDTRFHRPVDIVDAANTATKLNIYIECSDLLDQFPVMAGVLIEGGIEIYYLQPVSALINPLLRACNRIGVKNLRMLGISLGETNYFAIA